MIALCAFGGFYLANNSGSILSDSYKESITADAVSPSSIFLEKTAVVTITYRYRFCGHSETISASASDLGFSGFVEDELSFSNGVAEVRTFTPSMAEIIVDVDEYCPKHYIVKLYEDEVCLYKTNSQTGKSRRYLDLNITAEDVLPVKREELEEGVVFENTSDVNRYVKEIQK